MKTSIKRISKKVNKSSEANLLIKAAKNAGKNAIRTSKALGLDITYLKKGVIYKEKANGETVIFKGNQAIDTPKISLRKGMTLNAKN
jgi:hypothetical protein